MTASVNAKALDELMLMMMDLIQAPWGYIHNTDGDTRPATFDEWWSKQQQERLIGNGGVC